MTIINVYNGGHYHCADLTSISIPNSVTEIESGAFSGCTGLTSITIPNSVTHIGESAFSGCTGLTSITIPNSVSEIGRVAFSGCTGLTSITIPNSVTHIRQYAFSDCTGLTSITIPNSVTEIDLRAFSGCSALTSITIPNLVRNIGSGVFSGCTGLTSITIPNSVWSIEQNAFSGCTGLTSITIPNSVWSIEQNAFSGCTGLTTITIPNSVRTIGDYAFDGCASLTSITIPNSVRSIRQNAFRNTRQDCVAYVPVGEIEYYKQLLSSGGFNGSVVEISSNSSTSKQINEEAKTKVYSNSYDGYTNIRETPSLKGKIIGELRNGPDGAVLISKTEGWSKISCNGLEGYVYTKNLSTSPTEEVKISIDINWLKGIWSDNEQYAYLIFNNGTFAIQSTSGTLAYGTYVLKGNDIEFSIKQFLSSMEISKTQRYRIDPSTNRIGQLMKRDFLSESEQHNIIESLTWAESQYLALRKEIYTLVTKQ